MIIINPLVLIMCDHYATKSVPEKSGEARCRIEPSLNKRLSPDSVSKDNYSKE